MLNKVFLCGRLTADPELKHTTTNGTPVCSFTVAVDGNTAEPKTDFLDCVAWKGAAEFICKHFCKGKLIIIDGHLQKRDYEKDGQKRYVTEVIVERSFFAGDKKKAEESTESEFANADYAPITEPDDNLPY